VNTVSLASWFIDATGEAMRLGNPVLGNIIMIGALSRIGELPLDREDFSDVIDRSLPAGKQELNLKAFDIGASLLNTTC
jgi:indolepyruvate ferredoxin oxidoreductase beta subunit